LGEKFNKSTALKAVAGELLKVREPKGTAMMKDDDRWVIENFFMELVGEIEAKLGVFTGPVLGVKATDFLKVFGFDEEVEGGVVVDEAGF
jgi:hypothetical protein